MVDLNNKKLVAGQEKNRNIEDVLLSQIPMFEIFLKPTRLGPIYKQKAATQPTTHNTSATHEPSLTPEGSIPANEEGQNDKFDACT